MTLPNKLTVLRLILSPIFFVVYFLPDWTGGGGGISAAAVLLIFVVIEVSDVLDGYFARRLGLVSDIGKVIDPFADVMSRMTYFFCFTLAGLMPAWIFLLLIYRELGATFLRMLLIRRGIALAASVWGKAKAITYALGGILGVLHYFFHSYDLLPAAALYGIRSAAVVVFVLGALSSLLSFAGYLVKAAPQLRVREQ